MSLSRELVVAAKARADAAKSAFDTEVVETALIGDGRPGNGSEVRYAFELKGGHRVAEFISAAREDVPTMADALLRVLDIHTPIDALNTRYNVRQQVCTGCGTDDGNWSVWPCATVRAVTGEEGNRG